VTQILFYGPTGDIPAVTETGHIDVRQGNGGMYGDT